jgi:hypothetical protein
MIIIFFDIKGIVHKEFFLTDRTANSAYYRDELRRLRENVRRLRPNLPIVKKITDTDLYAYFFIYAFIPSAGVIHGLVLIQIIRT